MSDNTPSRFSIIPPAFFDSGIFAAMSLAQTKVLCFMLRHQPIIYVSEANVAKGCGINKGTVGQVLRGFAFTGLFTKKGRTKGKGLQSSNEYQLGDLKDPLLVEHLETSFSHPEFNKVMLALYRGKKSAKKIDPKLVEQFRWIPKTEPNPLQLTEEPGRTKELIQTTADPVRSVELEAISEPDSAPEATLSESEITNWLTQSGFSPKQHMNMLALIQEHGYKLHTLRAEFEDIEQDASAKSKHGCFMHRLKEASITGGVQIPGYDPNDDLHQKLLQLLEEKCFRETPVAGRGKQKIIATYWERMVELCRWIRTDECQELCKVEPAWVDGSEFKVHPWHPVDAFWKCYGEHIQHNDDDIPDGGTVYNALMKNLGNYIPSIEDEKQRMKKERLSQTKEALEWRRHEREVCWNAYAVKHDCIGGGDRTRFQQLGVKLKQLLPKMDPPFSEEQIDVMIKKYEQIPLELAERVVDWMNEHNDINISKDVVEEMQSELLEPYGGELIIGVNMKIGESCESYFTRVRFWQRFRPISPDEEYQNAHFRDYGYIDEVPGELSEAIVPVTATDKHENEPESAVHKQQSSELFGFQKRAAARRKRREQGLALDIDVYSQTLHKLSDEEQAELNAIEDEKEHDLFMIKKHQEQEVAAA